MMSGGELELQLIEALRAGNASVLGDLLEQNRKSLRRLIDQRIGMRVQSRLDPSDVLQVVYLDAAKRIHHFLNAEPAVPFSVWLRQIATQSLIDLQRKHTSMKRDVRRERSLQQSTDESSVIGTMPISPDTTPSQRAVRAEEHELLLVALELLRESDQDVLRMRHFEGRSNQEVAEYFGLSPSAACNRYVRALERVRLIMETLRHSFSKSNRSVQ